jgi:hypothetical protein
MKSTVGDVKGAKTKASMPVPDHKSPSGGRVKGSALSSKMPENNVKAQGIAKPDTIKKPGAVGKKNGLRNLM